MRIKTTTSSIILLSAVAFAATGCQQTRLIFRPAEAPQSRREPGVRQSPPRRILSPVRLAATQEQVRVEPVSTDPPPTEPASNEPALNEAALNEASSGVTKAVEDALVATVDQERPAVAYTAPPAWVRQLVLAVVSSIGSGDFASDADAGKEVSESLVHSAAGVTGRLGLTSPGTIVDGAVVGQIGTSGGGLASIGFGSSNNIHTLQRNPATGPGGRCGELTRAGLTANHSACAGGARRR